MELRNIKSFIKVAEFENFSKAAEVLGYAQSTITLQIQQQSKPFPKIPPLQAPCASARLNLSPAPFCPCFWKNI